MKRLALILIGLVILSIFGVAFWNTVNISSQEERIATLETRLSALEDQALAQAKALQNDADDFHHLLDFTVDPVHNPNEGLEIPLAPGHRIKLNVQGRGNVEVSISKLARVRYARTPGCKELVRKNIVLTDEDDYQIFTSQGKITGRDLCSLMIWHNDEVVSQDILVMAHAIAAAP